MFITFLTRSMFSVIILDWKTVEFDKDTSYEFQGYIILLRRRKITALFFLQYKFILLKALFVSRNQLQFFHLR
jgi:hypothetical protein